MVLRIIQTNETRKKKRYFLFLQMTIMVFLTCACAENGQVQTAVPGELRSDTVVESAASRQPEGEADDAKTNAVAETDADKIETTETDTEKAWAAKPDAEGRLPLSPDLNHNGIAEEVRLTDIENGQELEIWENGELIDREAGDYSHTGWYSIFLYTLDGKDYLLRYQPTMYQGVGTYSYSIINLTDNKRNVDKWSGVDFDINFGSPVYSGFDSEAIAAFMEEINGLLSHSVQLLNTEEELQGTFEREGRLYDSLWWLDGWEPDFVRDENKSLQENLEEFQTAMTAAQEPVVLEETEGLPITGPLELAFYSGAGAWSTYMVLEPDGSFAAYYHDTDGCTVYVCPYDGRFGKVEKLTDASWLLTLESLERDTVRSVGEEWDEEKDDHVIHYIASQPFGFTDAEEKALKPGAQSILYSPDAAGHEPGTELYGAVRFQKWMHEQREFIDSGDTLGCWGLQNLETGEGFFTD